MAETMLAAFLPGNSSVEMKQVPVPTPGPGQVLVKTKASTICGSDIRAIYREHLGKGPAVGDEPQPVHGFQREHTHRRGGGGGHAAVLDRPPRLRRRLA